MELDARLLKTHPLLSLLPALTLRRLITQAALDEYPKGAHLYRVGEPCEAIYLILSGRCQSTYGDGTVEAILGPGDTPGLRELLNNEPHRTGAHVLTHSVILRIPSAELERLFDARPSIAGRFTASLSGRISAVRRFPWSPKSEAHPSPRPRPRKVRRILSLATLSETTHAHAMRLAETLHEQAGGSVLLVTFGPDGGYPLARWEGVRAHGFNGEFRLEEQVYRHQDGVTTLHIGTSEEPGQAALVPSLLSHLGMHFDFVLLRLGDRLPAPVALECLVQSDLGYLFLRPCSSDLYQYRLLHKRLPPNAQLRLILYHEPSLPPKEQASVLAELDHPVHAVARDVPLDEHSVPSPAFARHLRRLAREIGQCRIGIALSSGGARGLAHIGVIQILEEHGIEVDMIAGASMGAYVGSIWAHGANGEALETIAREIEGRWGLLSLIDPVLPPRRGFITTRKVARRLRRSIGDARFHDLACPLRVVATQFETMERVVFSSGPVVPAVTASIAIPGVCVPVTIDSEMYIDGGIACPLPVDVLAEAGIEKIIAVNAIPTPEQLRRSVDDSGSPQASWLRSLAQQFNYFARGNILDIISRSTHGVQMRVAELAAQQADLVLHAVSQDARWHDFNHPGKYIALGRTVAESSLPSIRNLIERKSP